MEERGCSPDFGGYQDLEDCAVVICQIALVYSCATRGFREFSGWALVSDATMAYHGCI